MARYLALCFLIATALASVRGSELADKTLLMKTGLTLGSPNIPPVTYEPRAFSTCEHVSFTRGIKYGESEFNILDVATGGADTARTSPRPVLLFVIGERFTNEPPYTTNPVPDELICFAANNGMVGVKMTDRQAPTNSWPAGTKDVAAATSWLSQNIDLFGGDRNAIVAFGYSVSAFHIASLLAHREFQIGNSTFAGAILVSGIYHSNADASRDEKSYFGFDSGQYDQRSVFPGIFSIETPLLLVWSTLDSSRLITEGETLKRLLCNSFSHCPRTALLKTRDSLADNFLIDPPDGALAKHTLELVREIEARELP